MHSSISLHGVINNLQLSCHFFLQVLSTKKCFNAAGMGLHWETLSSHSVWWSDISQCNHWTLLFNYSPIQHPEQSTVSILQPGPARWYVDAGRTFPTYIWQQPFVLIFSLSELPTHGETSFPAFQIQKLTGMCVLFHPNLLPRAGFAPGPPLTDQRIVLYVAVVSLRLHISRWRMIGLRKIFDWSYWRLVVWSTVTNGNCRNEGHTHKKKNCRLPTNWWERAAGQKDLSTDWSNWHESLWFIGKITAPEKL